MEKGGKLIPRLSSLTATTRPTEAPTPRTSNTNY